MKLSLNSILLTPLVVAAFVNALENNLEDTAVFYEYSDNVDIKSHTSCIPLRNEKNEDVSQIAFGPLVTCNTYKSANCSGTAESEFKTTLPEENVDINHFGTVWPSGSVKCQ